MKQLDELIAYVEGLSTTEFSLLLGMMVARMLEQYGVDEARSNLLALVSELAPYAPPIRADTSTVKQ